jgi:galactokinase/mevalonate kinase-like predicted kinase
LAVYRLDPHLFLDPEYTDRYTLFYTGVTRLAKNILQEVVDQCNSMSPAYLFTLRRIGALADAAREAFALRDVDRFAKIVEMSWMENCLIHPSTTNPEISAMRKAVSPFYRGMKLLGAGGGGYGFFVSDNGESALRLREALEGWSVSAGNPRARVVDMALNQAGLQVTVS